MDAKARAPSCKRGLLVGLGIVCVTLGTVGIFVPGLPTTVFLLLGSWAFARSSPRLRLHAHPRLGEFLRLAEQRRMPRRACIVSIAAVWGGIALALVPERTHTIPLSGVLLAAGAVGTAFLVAFGSARRTAPVHARRRPMDDALLG